MSDALKPNMTLLVKIGSALIHFDEATSAEGRGVDMAIARRLLEDSDVRKWIKDMGALLPLKRSFK